MREELKKRLLEHAAKCDDMRHDGFALLGEVTAELKTLEIEAERLRAQLAQLEKQARFAEIAANTEGTEHRDAD